MPKLVQPVRSCALAYILDKEVHTMYEMREFALNVTNLNLLMCLLICLTILIYTEYSERIICNLRMYVIVCKRTLNPKM